MAIRIEHLADVLQALSDLSPMAPRLSDASFRLAWASFPETAKRELTSELLDFALCQYLLDPSPPLNQPVFLALLRYLYRLENDRPNFCWGLRQDLALRLRRPGFQPLPASQADLDAQMGLQSHDGAAHEPGGVLAALELLPSLPAAVATPCGEEEAEDMARAARHLPDPLADPAQPSGAPVMPAPGP